MRTERLTTTLTSFLCDLNAGFRASTDNLCADQVKLIKRETIAGATTHLNNQVNKTVYTALALILGEGDYKIN